ncbi:ABC transporter permease [Orrella sp. 11846]|uniref:ABC transporter permease n=1 Tax=Orrella sp. 11846 TaxID=3409913 RepID=UPI003B5AD26F
MRKLKNILRLAQKELWSLARDPAMLLLIVYVFTVSIYTSATSQPETLQNAAIAVVDEDRSPLSARIVSAFYPPEFTRPKMIELNEMDAGLDSGDFTFVLNIPPNFQRDVLAGKNPGVQLNIDATRMSQAFTGNGYIQQVVMGEVNEFMQRQRVATTLPVDLVQRVRFNPTLEKSWFGSIAEVINSVAMLSIILTGAALIREREHGTIEHLLVMPITPGEIMASKVLAMGLVVLIATTVSLTLVVRGLLKVPIEGSIPLFLIGVVLCLYAMTSLGIYMATVARTMPQFGLLLMLTLLPMNMLSGGRTPRESMPSFVQDLMQLAPTTHFVQIGQAILFRGAGMETVWKPFLALIVIGTVLYVLSLRRFRRTISQMA